MKNKLINALLPFNKQGDLDKRFQESIERIILDIGVENTHVLSEFYIKTSELQRSASKSGLELVEAIHRESDRLSSGKHRHPDDQYNWMSKSLRKSTAEILKKVGFKEKNASKIIKAAEFKQSLTIQSSWTSQLSVSHLSELGRMNEAGIRQAIAESCNSGTDLIGTAFGGIPAKEWKDVSVRRFEEIRRFNPKSIKEDNPLSKLDIVPDIQEPITIESTEIKEVTQESIARDIVSLAKQLNINDGWKDQKLIKILKEAEGELMGIAHIATLPIKELTTN